MGGGGEHRVHIVLLPGGHTLSAYASLALGGVLAGGGALDVAVGRHGKDGLLLLDEILNVDIVLHEADLGLALVAILVPDLNQLVLEHPTQLALVGQQGVEVRDALLQLPVKVWKGPVAPCGQRLCGFRFLSVSSPANAIHSRRTAAIQNLSHGQCTRRPGAYQLALQQVYLVPLPVIGGVSQILLQQQ